jgi:iron complex outermembrane receptor protein
MSSHFAASHRSTRRLAVFFATTVCLPVLAVPFVDIAAAQERAVAVRYEIAAGPLPQALNRFADASGLQLIYDAAATRSQRRR